MLKRANSSSGAVAGMRAANSACTPASPTRVNVPDTASTRIRSPSRTRASGPPTSASGPTWITAGTLPDAPDMRPSVTSATLWPASCSAPSAGVRRCNSGMPLAFGPWKRTTATTSRFSSSASKAACSASWESNTRAGASTIRCSSATADTLITPRPRLPAIRRSPPSFENGADAGASTAASPLVAGPSRQRSVPSVITGSSV
ncbi:hypothetical protein D3C71_1578540 [compost metagenome]